MSLSFCKVQFWRLVCILFVLHEITVYGAAVGDDIILSADVVNMGIVPAGTKSKGSFIITNRASESVLITRVEASCSCTAVNFKPFDLNHGEMREIDFVIDTHAKPGGEFVAIISVTCDYQGSVFVKKLEARIVINADGKLIASPNILYLGEVSRGYRASFTTVINQQGNGIRTTTISKVESPPWLECHLDKTSEKGRWVLTSKFTAPDSPGELRGVIRLSTDNEVFDLLTIPIHGDVAGSCKVTPNEIIHIIGNDTAGKSYKVTLENTVGLPFEIIAVKTMDIDSAELTVTQEPEKAPKGARFLQFKFSGDVSGGKHVASGSVQIEISSSTGLETVRCPILIIK